MEEKKPLIILTGPTAVGKTELSIQLAKAVNGEIISADSMQVYRGMNIGTAKITKKQMQGIEHHLIDILNPEEEFHVALFQQLAKEAIKQIYKKGKIPIIVGGTGFYIQAVLYDIDFTKGDCNIAYRKQLEQLAREKGASYLHEQLKEIDYNSYCTIHANNIKRVIRALEYYRQTGQKISEHNERERKKQSPYQFAYFVLYQERSLLYEKINQRVDTMIEEGLLEEVCSLYKKGYTKELISMQGIGYKELFPYLEGKRSLEEAIDQIKKDTRHFAKRQLTWFAREKEILMIEKKENTNQQLLSFLLEQLKKKKIVERN